MLPNSLVSVFLNVFHYICRQFQKPKQNKEGEGDMRLKKKLLKILGFTIECKSFIFNGLSKYLNFNPKEIGSSEEFVISMELEMILSNGSKQ